MVNIYNARAWEVEAGGPRNQASLSYGNAVTNDLTKRKEKRKENEKGSWGGGTVVKRLFLKHEDLSSDPKDSQKQSQAQWLEK